MEHMMKSALKLNVYAFTFDAVCPADSEVITYNAQIATDDMIRVEEINAFVGEIKSGFQEEIADKLLERFGGAQEITAVHQRVQIKTRRLVPPPMVDEQDVLRQTVSMH
jgi:hypothetical protein